MMRLIYKNDKGEAQEIAVQFMYGTTISTFYRNRIPDPQEREVEETTCTILAGPEGTTDEEKTVLAQARIVRNFRDQFNKVDARRYSLIKATEGMPKELRRSICKEYGLRSRWK